MKNTAYKDCQECDGGKILSVQGSRGVLRDCADCNGTGKIKTTIELSSDITQGDVIYRIDSATVDSAGTGVIMIWVD